MAPLKCQQNLVMLAIVMVLALGGILQSQGEESEEPWVGNNHIGLQQLSPTNYPKKDGTFNVKVEIRSHAPDGHVRFKFSNSNVSSWKGHAMNAGNELHDDPDLTLTVDQQTPQAGITWSAPPAEPNVQKIGAAWDGDAPEPFIVKVQVHDYGAYGTLTAQLYYDGEKQGGAVSLDLPRDDNGNKIADGWQNDTSENYDASADDEEGPTGNSNDGDGFSVYEEYRGFMVGGEHVRGDPAKKDLFIYSSLSEGIGYASALAEDTGEVFKVHSILQSEISGSHRIDYNDAGIPGGYTVEQKAVYVQEDTETEGDVIYDEHNHGPVYGLAVPKYPYNSPNVPSRMQHAIIYTQNIRTQLEKATETISEAEAKRLVIGHETGHCINLDDVLSTTVGYSIMQHETLLSDICSQDSEFFPASWHASEYKLVP